MPTILVNPMAENTVESGVAAQRLAKLEGATIGMLDISKPGGSVFLDRLESILRKRHGVAEVLRLTKPTFTKPAPDEIIQRLASAGCDAVIEALAD